MNSNSVTDKQITKFFFTTGVLTAVSSQLVLSTALFGMAALASLIRPAKRARI